MKKIILGSLFFFIIIGAIMLYGYVTTLKGWEEAKDLTEDNFQIIETTFVKAEKIDYVNRWYYPNRRHRSLIFFLIYTDYSTIPFRTNVGAFVDYKWRLGDIESIKSGDSLRLKVKKKDLKEKGEPTFLQKYFIGDKQKFNTIYTYDLYVNNNEYFSWNITDYQNSGMTSHNTVNIIILIIGLIFMLIINFTLKIFKNERTFSSKRNISDLLKWFKTYR